MRPAPLPLATSAGPVSATAKPPPALSTVLCFEDDMPFGQALADALNVPLGQVQRHRFPDGESRLTLPQPLSGTVLLLRGLHPPHDALVELLITAPAARELGAQAVWLASPYLAYMRQDTAFRPGEAVSQRHIARLLGQHFEHLYTVDPHLHRIAHLDEVMPAGCGVALSAAGLIGQFLADRGHRPLLLGPDEESAQWVRAAAAPAALEHAWCLKERRGDRDVLVTLPPGLALAGRHVVLVDDMASTGRTLVAAARLALAAGARQVDVAVAHALFVGDALAALQAAGVARVWSCDTVPHPSNAITVVPLLARALQATLAVEAANRKPAEGLALP